jgi:hypothetical protein
VSPSPKGTGWSSCVVIRHCTGQLGKELPRVMVSLVSCDGIYR